MGLEEGATAKQQMKKAWELGRWQESMAFKDLQTLSMNGAQDAREGKISQEARWGRITKQPVDQESLDVVLRAMGF